MIAENMVGANTIVDASIHYQYNSKLRLQTNIINLFNSTYEVSRVPFGLRPGHPLGINIGLRYTL